ncbi:MAG: DNA repair protein RecO [Blastocatellia bacterium]|nr:DNA repair protein RecO [Blastocatellia bacterium]
MALHETDAFTLKTFPYAENHRAAVFFTKQFGLVRAVAHGSRSLKNRYGAGLELFSEVHLKYREKEGREMVQLSDCELITSHFDAASQPETAALLAYWAELIIEFFPAHQANEHMYRLIQALLDSVERGLDGGDALLRYCETWILKFSGFLPDFQSCVTCGRTIEPTEVVCLARDGTPECPDCSHSRGVAVTGLVRQTIHRMVRRPPAEFAALPLDEPTRKTLETVYHLLITAALERELKSYAILRQMRS